MEEKKFEDLNPVDERDDSEEVKDLFQEIESEEKAEIVSDVEDVSQTTLSDEESIEDRSEDVNANTKGKNKFLKELVSYGIIILVAFGLARVINHFIVTKVAVEGSSMEPTFYTGDSLLLWNLGEPDRFDVVVVHLEHEEKAFIKRLIGLPGDYIEYRNEVLYINGEPISEPYVAKANTDKDHYTLEDVCTPTSFKYQDRDVNCNVDGQIRIPEGYYFVLGDNRAISEDGEDFGLVSEKEMLGKIIFRFSPDFGPIK